MKINEIKLLRDQTWEDAARMYYMLYYSIKEKAEKWDTFVGLLDDSHHHRREDSE